MDYRQIVEGARRYGLQDNIYDIASYMVSNYGVPSKEALAGIFMLIFSWNRDYYSPPGGKRKSIQTLDQSVRDLERIIEAQKELILGLSGLRLENVEFEAKLGHQEMTVGTAVSRLFSEFVHVLGPTGASKALHLLLPRLIVLWDTQIRIDYGYAHAAADDFLEFQKGSKKLLDCAAGDFQRKHGKGRDEALQAMLHMRYGAAPKPIPKLLDEFNWATRGKGKKPLLIE